MPPLNHRGERGTAGSEKKLVFVGVSGNKVLQVLAIKKIYGTWVLRASV